MAEETLGSQRSSQFITIVSLISSSSTVAVFFLSLFESGLGSDICPAIRQVATGGQQKA